MVHSTDRVVLRLARHLQGFKIKAKSVITFQLYYLSYQQQQKKFEEIVLVNSNF